MMRSILNFYGPYTCSMMDAKFQRMQAFAPLIWQGLIAILGVIPLFRVHCWLLGTLCVIGMFIIIRTIYSGMMYMSSFPKEEDGGRYVSRSMAGPTDLISSLFGLATTVACFMITAHLTGWDLSQ
jgi:hypothetical protein